MSALAVQTLPVHELHLAMHQSQSDPTAENTPNLWEAMAEELVELIAAHLVPETPYISRPLMPPPKRTFADSSVGAAHWVQLCRALVNSAAFRDSLARNRRHHFETAACCRVLENHNLDEYDWPLMVLKLRASKVGPQEAGQLSHTTPIARHTLRAAYREVAREVRATKLECVAVAHGQSAELTMGLTHAILTCRCTLTAWSSARWRCGQWLFSTRCAFAPQKTE